jgi:cytochrome P450
MAVVDAGVGLPVLDLADEAVWREPARSVQAMHDAGHRLAWVPGFETVALLRHADCAAALVDHARLGNIGSRYFELQGWADGAFVAWTRRNIVMVDPPDHTRLRALVNRAFTPRRVQELHATTVAVAHELCDEAAARGSVELVHDWARRLPLHVIVQMLGMPSVDAARMGEWTEALSAASGLPTPEARAAGDRAMEDFSAYVQQQIEIRRREPADDLLHALVVAEEDGDRLDGDELVAMVVQLLFAGHETTRNLISSLVYRLCEHPDAMAAVRADRTLVPSAVEESLRYDPPIWFTSRIAHVDHELAGVPVAAGQLVVLHLTAANVDPDHVPDPHRFDVTRTDVRHLSFGWGLHHCLGASLARLEARVALEVLLDRFAVLEPTGPASRWMAFTPLRTRERLELAVVPT